MNSDRKRPIPVNLVSGPLGVGKTTAINYLLTHRPPGEKWAVLINEYGLVGLDAALLNDANPSDRSLVREVAGGCICCSASFMFDVSLVLLLQRRPDRLLIEPTGLATLSGILDTLGRSGIREAVDVRSVICLLDPARLRADLTREEVKDQIDAADVLLANRPDLAGIDHLEAFDAWAQDIFPPKRFVGRVDHGRIPMEVLDLVANREPVPRDDVGADHHLHRHAASNADDHGTSSAPEHCDVTHPIVRREHRSPAASTIGWVCWNGLVFDSNRVARWLSDLANEPGVRRVKAVMHTDDGWWSLNVADGTHHTRPTGYRRDSRLELVIEGDAFPPADELERSLRGCVTSKSVPVA